MQHQFEGRIKLDSYVMGPDTETVTLVCYSHDQRLEISMSLPAGGFKRLQDGFFGPDDKGSIRLRHEIDRGSDFPFPAVKYAHPEPNKSKKAASKPAKTADRVKQAKVSP